MSACNLFSEKFGVFIKSNENLDLVKFVHASDIHLGAMQYRNTYRTDDFINAFQEILAIAIINKVDFIILGGDVFTSLDILPEQLNKIVQLLIYFKSYTKENIPIIAIEGNHDLRKYTKGMKVNNDQSWLKFISNLGLIQLLNGDISLPSTKIFPKYDLIANEGGKIKIKNILIYGTRYFGDRDPKYIQKIQQAIKKDDNFFHILLAHFGIEGQMENVPGMKYEKIKPLKSRIDYLALGHYHKQFILEDWIYNPGSSEAVCSIDHSYKRSIFLVEVRGNGVYSKKVEPIRLKNRKYLWVTINFPKKFEKKSVLKDFLIKKLNKLLNHLNSNLKPSDYKMPILYILLKGFKPKKSCNFKEKEIISMICQKFPVIDVRIYHKFSDPIKSLDCFF